MSLQGPPSPAASVISGRRATGRLRVRLAARLVLLSGTQDCVLTDLSSGGARVILSRPAEDHGDAVLLWCGFEAFGRMIWCAGERCGIAFDKPLPRQVLLKTRGLDRREHLPEEHELLRRTARSFVSGHVRL